MSNDTVCKYCCFAEWSDDGITQTDCKLGMIQKYRKIGSSILECYDEDKEFYVIKNRICPFNRSDRWLEHFREHYQEILDKETRPIIHVIILFTTLDELRQTITTIDDQEFPPVMVTVFRPWGCKTYPSDIVKILENTNYKWKIHNQLKQDESIDYIIHQIQRTVPYQYYLLCKAGEKIPHDLFSGIQDITINKLQQFGCITHEGIEVIPRSVHNYWYFHGDPNLSIVQNIKDWEEKEGENVCLTYQQIKS